MIHAKLINVKKNKKNYLYGKIDQEIESVKTKIDLNLIEYWNFSN